MSESFLCDVLAGLRKGGQVTLLLRSYSKPGAMYTQYVYSVFLRQTRSMSPLRMRNQAQERVMASERYMSSKC